MFRTALQDFVYLISYRCRPSAYVAPESYALGIYSCKSDVWQAGLSLYCAVCAEYAFDILPPSRGHFNRWRFKKGKSFALLSDSVQDLLTNMLNPIEWERISLQDALKHPWFHGEAPNVLLGESYEKKIAKLKLRGELKKFFISKDITAEAAERSAALKKNLHAAMTPRGISPFKGVPIESLHKLKEVVYEGLMAKAKRSGSFTDEGLDTILDDQPPAPLKRTYTDLILDGEVDFEGFERLMQSVNLMSMANRTIFRIFDSNNDGSIDLREFLFALVSFRRADDPFPDAARLFFDMFDADGDGAISRNELHAVAQCLLEDGMTDSITEMAGDIENLFETIHNKDEETVEFAEFKVFYERIIRRSLSPHRNRLPSPAIARPVVEVDLPSIPEASAPLSPPKLKLPPEMMPLSVTIS